MPVRKIDKIIEHSPSSNGALQKLIRNANEKAHLTRILKYSSRKYLSGGIKSVKKKGKGIARAIKAYRGIGRGASLPTENYYKK